MERSTGGVSFVCTTYIVLRFPCVVNEAGPVDQLHCQEWSTVMQELEQLRFVRKIAWSTVQNAPQSLVIIADHGQDQWVRYAQEELAVDHVKKMSSVLYTLHGLTKTPRMLTSVVPMGNTISATYRPSSTVLDLYCMKATMQKLPPMIQKRTDLKWMYPKCVDPVAYRITLQSYLNTYTPPFVPQGQKPNLDGDLLSYTRTTQLSSISADLEPGDSCDEMMVLGWKSSSARRRFQDQMQPSVAAGSNASLPYNLFQTAFAEPFQDMRQTGQIKGAEHWVLDIKAWPLVKSRWSPSLKNKLPLVRRSSVTEIAV